jgi:hypothetical protein
LQKNEDILSLPFDSTVFKPIATTFFLAHENGSSLCLTVTSHLQSLSRKIVNQKDLYIKDNWRSLYQTIFNAIDGDKDFLEKVYATQEEFYTASLKVRQENDRARKSRRRLNEIIVRVLFQENPTSSLALMHIPNPATYDAWINATSPSGKDKLGLP